MAIASAHSTAPILGDRETGNDVRKASVSAVGAVSNLVKSSLGPQGLDKMIVDDIGEVTVSNDGTTILKLLEIKHPAAKLLVELAEMQDKEVGDGTTSVVLIAAELLRRAQALVEAGNHPTNVIAGYKLAMKEAVKYIQTRLAYKTSAMSTGVFNQIAQTAFFGDDKKFFADLVTKAMDKVKVVTASGAVKYPTNAVNILKTHGQGRHDSFLVDGYALARMSRVSQGMPMLVQNAKVALIDFNLRQHRLQLGVQVQIESPEELDRVRQKEKDVTKGKIEKIIAAGANVVVTTQGIDDMSVKYFVEKGIMALRRVEKKDLKRIAKATGGTVCHSLSNMDSEEEAFDSQWLGSCAKVSESRVGDWDYIFFQGCAKQQAQTIILRGANEYMLDELERSLHDSLCAVSRAKESELVCAGGGAVETALAVYLEDFARTLGSREQMPIAEFANSLLVIPRTLALNAAQDACELVAQLRAKHHREQHSNTTATADAANASPSRWGLDLTEGTVQDSFAAGVIEPVLTKTKALRVATEAAVTILRIDDMIKLHPEPEPERRQ